MRIGQGRENVKKFLKDNPTVCSEIESKLRAEMAEALASNAMPVGVTSNDDDDDDESTEAERIMDETTISDDELEDDLGFSSRLRRCGGAFGERSMRWVAPGGMAAVCARACKDATQTRQRVPKVLYAAICTRACEDVDAWGRVARRCSRI